MKQDCTASSWLRFFMTAGIPKESAEMYAVTFSNNQIHLDMLPEIKKEYLVDMGISLMGHIIAILRHAKTVHNETVTKATLLDGDKAKTQKLTVPKIAKIQSPVPTIVKDVKKNGTTVEPSKPEVSTKYIATNKVAQKRPAETEISRPAKVIKMVRINPPPVVKNPLPVVKNQPPVKKVIKPEVKIDEVERKIVVKCNEVERKRVFSRLEPLAVSSNETSIGESVFARLGIKDPPVKTIKQSNGEQKIEPIIKFKDSFKQDILANKILGKGTMRADETTKVTYPKAVTNHTVHARLGSNKKESILKTMPTTTSKQVRFSGITQKMIPIEKNKFDRYKNANLNNKRLSTPADVFSRLGI